MDGRCKDCRHWSTFGVPLPEHSDWGQCAQAQSTDNKPDNPDTLAYADDGPNFYTAALMTRDDFGCVMFEAKEAACSQ